MTTAGERGAAGVLDERLAAGCGVGRRRRAASNDGRRRLSGRGGGRSDALLDEVAGGGRGETGAEAEQGVEGRGGMPAAVPAEDELVEVALQVLAAQAVEGPEPPALEVREDAVRPAQHDVSVIGQAGVAGPSVGDDASAGRGDGGDERSECGRGEVGDRREADAAGLAVGREL